MASLKQNSHHNADSVNNYQTSLDDSLRRLNLNKTNYITEGYSPLKVTKVAPSVPPKPRVKPLIDKFSEKGYNANVGHHSTSTTYSNIPLPPEEELPLPPPPVPYAPVENQSFPDPPKDLTPPPGSPSSSSIYAGPASSSSYATYRPHSSNSSYDASSIYEPINPRPSSQMSNRSSYSTASGISSLYSAGSYYPNRSRIQSKPIPPVLENDLQSGGKEEEVDHLTDLLVQSMENANDPVFFGMCYKCGETVLGEGSGCTAMGQVYHIKCFTCKVCHKQLKGLRFYSMDGKPYCEEDYLNTLEKCSVCNKPIMDRILRATGKPYHPDCFTCVECNQCLDGIPFTVDNANRIHCIEDFHKKFAPRCCVCKNPIMPEAGQQETVRIVALDRSFHVYCYKCEDCGLTLSSEVEGRGCYPLDDHILCRNCNAKRVQQLTAAK